MKHPLVAVLFWVSLSCAAGHPGKHHSDSAKAGDKDCVCTTKLYFNFCVALVGVSPASDSLTIVRTVDGKEDTLIFPAPDSTARTCFPERRGNSSVQVYRGGKLVKDSNGIAVGTIECCHAQPKKIVLKVPAEMPAITIVIDSANRGKQDSIVLDSTSITRWRGGELLAKKTFPRTHAYRKIAARLERIPAGEYSAPMDGGNLQLVYFVKIRAGNKAIVCSNCRLVTDKQGKKIRNLVREVRELLR